jgi:phospholipid/cholesterol/gamma-HCH transport system permease protein
MKISEQVDAMEASAVDPLSFLVAPRVAACVLMMPLLTLIANFCGIFTGWVANTFADPVSLRHFVANGFQGLMFSDFIPPTLKTLIFGWIVGIVSCFEGMRTTGGTEGVGRAAKTSVVLSSLFVILADVLLVRIILLLYP